MDQAFLVGRIVVGAYYLYSAINHFTRFEMMTAFAGSKGVPLPGLAIIVSGLLLAIAGLCLLLGVFPKVAVGALVLFFVPVTLIMHAFWKETDPMQRMSQMVNFTKNFALLGTSLMVLAIPEPWPFSVRRRLAGRPVLAPG